MLLTIYDLNTEYERALTDYLGKTNEAALLKARSLGKRALTGNLGARDLIVLHHKSLARILNDRRSPDPPEKVLLLASAFLCETLSSFEIMHQSFEDLTGMLNRLVQFAQVVCHELRTPLTSLLSSAGVLNEILKIPSDSIEKRLLDNIMLSTDSLRERTGDLQDLVGLHSGMLTIKPETMRPDEAIGNVLSRMNDQILSAGLRLKVEIQRPLPAIKADPRRYEQVITNLLRNAMKYGVGGEVIEIRAYEKGMSVIAEVEDHGHGMSAWDRLNMFHPGYGQNHVRDVPDLGIGMALSKELVTQFGGSMTFDNREGKGAIFRVELPQA